MSSRITVVLSALAVALVFAIATPSAGATTSAQYKDQLSKANLRLVARYVEEDAVDHNSVFPATVSRVDYPHCAWPKNPWTGAAMSQSASRGDYVYLQLESGESYSISTKLSTGHVFTLTTSPFTAVVRGIVTGLKSELARRSARLVRGYIDMWATLNNGCTPLLADLSATGLATVTNGYWPGNPFTGGAPMEVSGAVGDLAYARDADGVTYHLGAHLQGGEYTIDATAPQTIPDAIHSWKNELVKADVDRIASAVDAYARYNAGVYPEAVQVGQEGTVAVYLDAGLGWPQNPYVARSMQQSGYVGDFAYAKGVGSYTLTGHLWGGGSYVVTRP